MQTREETINFINSLQPHNKNGNYLGFNRVNTSIAKNAEWENMIEKKFSMNQRSNTYIYSKINSCFYIVYVSDFISFFVTKMESLQPWLGLLF